MDEVLHFIVEHGFWSYPITFAWTFVEGETFVIFAGFAAAQGMLSAPLLLASAWLGSFLGDQCYFWIGRRFGLRLLSERPRWRARVDTALGWLKRYDTGFILSFRFIYGVRNFSSFAMGISGIRWNRFLVLNFIAAGVWAFVFVGVGYLSGHVYGRAMGEWATQFSLVALGVFALVLIAITAFHWLKARRKR